jgi:hypothetical protein
MTLTNLSITLTLIPAAAHLADRGLPRLGATSVVLGIAAACSIPMLLAVGSRHLAAAWLMQVRVRVAWQLECACECARGARGARMRPPVP